MKKSIKIIIAVFVLSIFIGGITVIADNAFSARDIPYKNTNVESALNDLYDVSKVYSGNIEKIYTSSDVNISHTYTVLTSGTYLVGVAGANPSSTPGTITLSGGQVKLEQDLTNGNRSFSFKLVELSASDTIEIAMNSYYKSAAFIYKINDYNFTQIDDANLSKDVAATKTYTATNREVILAVTGYFGKENLSRDMTFSGKFLSQDLIDTNIIASYIVLDPSSSVTLSSNGYNWGGGFNIILK